MVETYKIKTTLMCIIELSNESMYEFRYDYIKNKYGKKLRLLFTDTDSLVYEVETDNIYDNFSKIKEAFELKYYNDSNALVVGKMKDKMGNIAIEEFVELMSKMYSILVRDLQI